MPAVSGKWNLAQRSGTFRRTGVSSARGPFEWNVVFVRDAYYGQFLWADTNPDCFWLRRPAPELLLLPPPILVVIDARSSESGVNMALSYVLRSIGFDSGATELAPAVDRVRVFVSLETNDGMIQGWSVSRSSLNQALEEADFSSRTAPILSEDLDSAAGDGTWEVHFTHIGDPVDVQAPPALDPTDPRCAS